MVSSYRVGTLKHPFCRVVLNMDISLTPARQVSTHLLLLCLLPVCQRKLPEKMKIKQRDCGGCVPSMFCSFSPLRGQIQHVPPPGALGLPAVNSFTSCHGCFCPLVNSGCSPSVLSCGSAGLIRSHVASEAGTTTIPGVRLDYISFTGRPEADFTLFPLSHLSSLPSAF